MQARLAVDIGGTFTDVLLECGTAGQGSAQHFVAKVLTTPKEPEQAVLRGVKEVLETARLAPADVQLVIHGTTLATNAILERVVRALFSSPQRVFATCWR